MAARIRNLFSRKHNSKKPELDLKTSSYDAAVALKEPVKGSYPVGGNGPIALTEHARGRSMSMRKRLSMSSTKAAPPMPTARDHYAKRPTTAPHTGFPAAVRDHERTQSGFSTTSPPNFSRKPTPEPLHSPTYEPKGPSNLRIAAYASPPEHAADEQTPEGNLRQLPGSPAFQQARNTSAYVDLLDAASNINHSRSSSVQRTRASGRRNYGEDVADRNIADFGSVDLSSPQFSYLRALYAREKTKGPGEGYNKHRSDTSAWEHILGPGGESDNTQTTAVGHSRNTSGQTISPPTPSKRTSSLTSASINEYGTKPSERPGIAISHQPNLAGQSVSNAIQEPKGMASPPPPSSKSTDRSLRTKYPAPASQSTMIPALPPPPVKSSDRLRMVKTPPPGPVFNGYSVTTPKRRSSVTSSKSYVPGRGPQTDAYDQNAIRTAPRTRALSMGKTSSVKTSSTLEGAKAAAVAAAAASKSRSKGDDIEAYSSPPPMPTSSRFARQQPTPPMSPIPDLSPTSTSSTRSRTSPPSSNPPTARRRSHASSITYTAFPPVSSSNRHSKHDSRASITPSEASDNTATPHARNPRRDGIIMNPSSNSSAGNGFKDPSPYLGNSTTATDRNADAVWKSRSGFVGSEHEVSESQGTVMPQSRIKTLARGLAAVTIPLKHNSSGSIGSQKTVKEWRPVTAPSSASSPPPIPYVPSSHSRKSTATSHRSVSSTSTIHTVRAQPLSLENTTYADFQARSRSGSASSRSRWGLSSRSRSTSNSNVNSTINADALDALSNLDGHVRNTKQPQVQSRSQYQHQKRIENQPRSQTQQQYYKPEWYQGQSERRLPLPPLKKNYVDGSDAGDEYASADSSTGESEGSSLLFHEGNGGFGGMLPGLGQRSLGVLENF